MRDDTAERMRGALPLPAAPLPALFDDEDDGEVEERSGTTSGSSTSCWRPSARRSHDLRRSGQISDEAMRRVLRDLDLEEARLEI